MSTLIYWKQMTHLLFRISRSLKDIQTTGAAAFQQNNVTKMLSGGPRRARACSPELRTAGWMVVKWIPACEYKLCLNLEKPHVCLQRPFMTNQLYLERNTTIVRDSMTKCPAHTLQFSQRNQQCSAEEFNLSVHSLHTAQLSPMLLLSLLLSSLSLHFMLYWHEMQTSRYDRWTHLRRNSVQ